MTDQLLWMAEQLAHGGRCGSLEPQRIALMSRGLIDFATEDDAHKQTRNRTLTLTEAGWLKVKEIRENLGK
ncbi:MAG TPA: hypothetical protein VGH72_33835 [Pseudonocardia sp.]|jgi:hypothetical protein